MTRSIRRRVAGACAGLAATGSLTVAAQPAQAATDGGSAATTTSTTATAGTTATNTPPSTATTAGTTTTASSTTPATRTTTTPATTTTVSPSQAVRGERSLQQAVARAVAQARAEERRLVRERARARRRWLAREHRAHARAVTARRQAVARRAAQQAAARRAAATSTTATRTTSSTTTTSSAVSARDIALSRLSAVQADGALPPQYLIAIYRRAAWRYHVPWTLLAAINAVETDYGRDLKVSSAGAEGWMQFEPSTWERYGVRVGDSTSADPYDPRDAIYAAARYLRASGAPHHLRRAVFAYNHARSYVDEVLLLSADIAAGEHVTHTTRARVRAMLATARLLSGLPYVWGGGHADGWRFTGGYDCSGFVSAVLHAAGYLSEPQTTQTLPAQTRIERGPGRWVTIFDRTDAGTGDDHVIIDIRGQWWESGGSSTAGGAGDVHRIRHISAAYLQTFNLVLHPKGM